MSTTQRTGTHYFLNQNAAIRYYAEYGSDRKEVARKLRDKEICLGMPPKKEGSRIILNGKEGRYYYEETAPSSVPPALPSDPTKTSTLKVSWPEPDPERVEVKVDSLHVQSSSMTVEQIEKAVDDGLTVHWKTDNFTVFKDAGGVYMIRDDSTNNSVITLDGQYWNGAEFYITDKAVTTPVPTVTVHGMVHPMPGATPEDVTPEQRKVGKSPNFLADYGTTDGLKNETPAPVQIKTNNVPKELLFFHDLTMQEANDLGTREDTNSFFRHKGVVYDASQFFQITGESDSAAFYDRYNEFTGWDGIKVETETSGILIRYPRIDGDIDPERVVIGTFYVGEEGADPRATNNVPNLDAENDVEKLREFAVKHEGGKRLKDLFPSGGEGTKNATADLANYAWNKLTAIECRKGPKRKVADALQYEAICDRIYSTLPKWAKGW